MKIIHSSDWHLGHVFYQNSREDEFEHFFLQLLELIRVEHPDVLVISGDIFHTATPSVVTQKQYYNILRRLSILDEDLQIVVVAGNHDSPSRLEAPRELLQSFNITVVGVLDHYYEDDCRVVDWDKFIVPIRHAGMLCGWVLAVPFINASNYPALESDDCYDNRVASFYQNLVTHLKQYPDYDGQPIVATGHFMAGGSNLEGHDQRLFGGLDSVDAAKLNSIDAVDYWALGHIHKPQPVAGNHYMRYSGTPIPISFDESYEHNLIIVELTNEDKQYRKHPITPLIPIRDFPFKPSGFDDAHSLEEVCREIALMHDEKCYMRVHVASRQALTHYETAEISRAFEGKNAIFCLLQTHFPLITAAENTRQVRNIEELKNISPFELGCEAYRNSRNEEMPEELKIMFKEICDSIENR